MRSQPAFSLSDRAFWSLLSSATRFSSFALVSALAVHVLIYRLVPYRRLEWRLVVSGAALAALLFEVGKSAFVFYLNRVANLEALYGSVSSIIVLLLWLYYSGRVILFGAALMKVRNERASTPD